MIELRGSHGARLYSLGPSFWKSRGKTAKKGRGSKLGASGRYELVPPARRQYQTVRRRKHGAPREPPRSFGGFRQPRQHDGKRAAPAGRVCCLRPTRRRGAHYRTIHALRCLAMIIIIPRLIVPPGSLVPDWSSPCCPLHEG